MMLQSPLQDMQRLRSPCDFSSQQLMLISTDLQHLHSWSRARLVRFDLHDDRGRALTENGPCFVFDLSKL